jgi:protein gp37
MAETSKIEWTDHTFNPWVGCSKVSPGCQNCYAETLMDKRMGFAKWGPAGTRVRTSVANWKLPLKWNRQAKRDGVRKRVFCASLADVFEDRAELVPWRAELFELIDATQNLDWLLLTKRPENILRLTPWGWGSVESLNQRPEIVPAFGGGMVRRSDGIRPNVWIGTSVENQATADERIPELLKVPAAVRFLSCEPLLGPVDLGSIRGAVFNRRAAIRKLVHGPAMLNPDQADSVVLPVGIHWVIVGGESGPNARPMHPQWAMAIRDQCAAAGVPFFFKQWGMWLEKSQIQSLAEGARWWPSDELEGRHMRPVLDGVFQHVGKKAAGRLLDGVLHDAVPDASAREECPVVNGNLIRVAEIGEQPDRGDINKSLASFDFAPILAQLKDSGKPRAFREGDEVKHIPSGETWVLAAVRDDDVIPAGWPCAIEKASECELVKAATDKQHATMVKNILDMDGDDIRKRWVRSKYPQERVPCGKWKHGERRSELDGAVWESVVRPFGHGFRWDVSLKGEYENGGMAPSIDAAKLAAEDALESLAREILAGIGRE